MKEGKNSKSQTKLRDHKFVNKKLVPPLAELNFQNSSWVDDRFPEMLWAALLIAEFSREESLERFENVVDKVCSLIDTSSEEWRKKPLAVTISGIASLEKEARLAVIKSIAVDERAIDALSPLLLFDKLPAKEEWKSVINSDRTSDNFSKLAKAISVCFFHQTQEATDCRWIKTLFSIKSGLISFTANVAELPKLILEYRTHTEEDLRKSRPSVRSMEIGTDSHQAKTDWAKKFWNECYSNTRCLPEEPPKNFEELYPSKDDLLVAKKRLEKINQGITTHFWSTLDSSDRNPKHEVTFGIALYAGDVATSSILLGSSRTALSRMVLRTLVECLIVLKYLIQKDEEELWSTFQGHGMGQAKLVSQRSEEEERNPAYLDAKNLGQIANDDKWVELLTVDIGNWDNSNLRQMSIDTKLKAFYDDYYTWCSSYTHGQWGAIREVSYSLCANPLHRFHRIPLLHPFTLQDATEDIYLLLEKIIELVYQVYPKSD